MYASSCSSSLEKNTVALRLDTRTRERLAGLRIYNRSTGRRCACLDSDYREEPLERLRLRVCDLGREEHRSDEKNTSGCPFRQ